MVVFALTLIRHCETAHNKDNVIQGQMDVPLSSVGLRQAERLGFYLQYQQYSHVYASDLTRAKQTAESIIRQNISSKATLLPDHRLRERKFGIVEGKSFKYLKEAAEKSNQNTGQYTPPGGETLQQVQERAISFFQDLCEMVKEKGKAELANESSVRSGANTEVSAHFENGKSNGQKRKWEMAEAGGVQDVECQNSQNKAYIKDATQKSNSNTEHESTINFKSDNDDFKAGMCISQAPKESESIYNQAKNDCSVLKSSSYKSKAQEDTENFSIMFTDDVIRSQIMSSCSDLPNVECPNVSLSPLVDHGFITHSGLSNIARENGHSVAQHERRLSVCSSCDDADSGPTLMANVLVVTHGCWLRELFRHFVDELECSLPGGKRQALRISPNAGLSKFTVSIEDHDGYPKIICLQIHDKQHLISSSYTDTIMNTDDMVLPYVGNPI